MTIDSYLDSGALRSACTEYIIYLQNENDSYNTVLSRIDAFLGNTSSDSVAINALKSQLSNYIPAVNLLIKANEYDIDCCHKLCDNCGSGVYDGYEILRNESKTQTSCINNLFMSESNKNKFNREIEQLANSNPTLRMLYNVSNFDIDDLSKNPTLYNTFIAEVSKMDPVLATYAQQMAQRKVLAAINKTEYNYWHSRHIEFDEIENLSNGLFVLSEEYRRIATMIILEISTSFNNGLYSKTPKTWNKIIEDIVNGIAISNEINHDINKPQIDRDSSDIDIEKLIKEYMFLSKNKDHWGDPVAREKAAQRMKEIEELLGLSAAQIFVFSIANAIKHCLDPAFTDKDVSSYVDFASGEANIDFDGHDDLTVDEIEDLIDEYERLEESRPHCPSKDAQDGILRRMHEIEDTISGYVDNAKNPNNLSEDEFNKLINEYYTYRDKDHWGDPTGRKIAGDRMREIEEILGLTQEEIYALAIAGSFMARIGKNDGKLKPSDSNTNKKIFNTYDSPLNSVPYEDVPVEDLTTEQVQTLIEKYRELCAQSNAYSLDPAISENIKKISQKLTDYNEYFLSGSKKHSQEFTAAYKYMMRFYGIDELTEFVLYWKTVDDYDYLSGREMPKEWLSAHSTVPAEFINHNYDDEVVISELCSNQELKTWYYENYFIIELISGQPYYDEFVNHAYDKDFNFKIDDPDEMQSEDVFYRWVQNVYPTLFAPKEDPIEKIQEYLDLLNNPDPTTDIKQIESYLDYYCCLFMDKAHHSLNFKCAYKQLLQQNFSYSSLSEIVMYWASIDGYDNLTGRELPEKYLNKLQYPTTKVTEDNVLELRYDQTFRNSYLKSYFILDLINGQQNYGSKLDDSYLKYILEGYDEFNGSCFESWYLTKYMGMYDYVTYVKEGVRESYAAVKYWLSTYYGIPNLESNNNNLDQYTVMAIKAFLGKEGNYNSYYEKNLSSTNSAKVLLNYMVDNKSFSKLTQEELNFLNSFYNDLKAENEPPYKPVVDILDWFKESDKTIWDRSNLLPYWDEDTHTLRLEYYEDTYFISSIEFSFEELGYVDIFNNTYISKEVAQNIILQYSNWKVTNDIYDIGDIDDFHNFIETMKEIADSFNIDIDSYTEEELKPLVDYTAIMLDYLTVYQGSYLNERTRDAGSLVKVLKDTVKIISLFSFVGWPINVVCIAGNIIIGGLQIYSGDDTDGILQIIKSVASLSSVDSLNLSTECTDLAKATEKLIKIAQDPFGSLDSEVQDLLLEKIIISKFTPESFQSYIKEKTIASKATKKMYTEVYKDICKSIKSKLSSKSINSSSFNTLDFIRAYYTLLNDDEKKELEHLWDTSHDYPFPLNSSATEEEFNQFISENI